MTFDPYFAATLSFADEAEAISYGPFADEASAAAWLAGANLGPADEGAVTTLERASDADITPWGGPVVENGTVTVWSDPADGPGEPEAIATVSA